MNEKTKQKLATIAFIISILSLGMLILTPPLFLQYSYAMIIFIFIIMIALSATGIVLSIISDPQKNRIAIAAFVISLVIFVWVVFIIMALTVLSPVFFYF